MTHDVRVLHDEDELAMAAAVFRTAMVGLPFSADLGTEQLSEPGRTLGVNVGGDLVGAADSYTSWLTVPGGRRVPHGAVTHVGVLPTHTRRGILTALLRHQITDLAARGEVVASLRASEAVIYERFGYAVATRSASFELNRRRGRLRESVPHGGRVRLIEPSHADKLLPEIYSSAAWVGAIDRPPYWWSLRRLIAASTPGPRYIAVHGDEGAEDGYATYRPLNTADWFGARERAVLVDDFVATSPRSYLGLVEHFAKLDLVDVVRFAARPVDDPLPALFTDTRAVALTGAHDETWLRIIDVPAALAARSYRPGRPVTIAVVDELLPANSGTYRIAADAVQRSDEPADLSVDVAALAATYLGGVCWSALATAGRVVEHRPGAVQDADEQFATTAEPFAGTGF